jgi:hypothetical protein
VTREHDERESQALLKAAEIVRKRAAIQQTKAARSAVVLTQPSSTEADAAAPVQARNSSVVMSKLKLQQCAFVVS